MLVEKTIFCSILGGPHYLPKRRSEPLSRCRPRFVLRANAAAESTGRGEANCAEKGRAGR